jgi:hypothetical protein
MIGGDAYYNKLLRNRLRYRSIRACRSDINLPSSSIRYPPREEDNILVRGHEYYQLSSNTVP